MKALLSRCAPAIAIAIVGTVLAVAFSPAKTCADPAPSPLVSNSSVRWLQTFASAHARLMEGKTVADLIDSPLAATRIVPTAAHPDALGNPVAVTSAVQTTDYTSAIETIGKNSPTNIDPVWDPAEQYIYYASNQSKDGLFHLYAMSPTGAASSAVQISTSGLNERWPALISSTEIVYCQSVGTSAAGPYSLYVAPITVGGGGAPVINLAAAAELVDGHNLDCQHPAYGGDLIAFAARTAAGQNYHIFTTTISGSVIHQISFGIGDEENPSLDPLPNAQTPLLIAFDSDATSYNYLSTLPVPLSAGTVGSYRNIWVIDANGSNAAQVTTAAGVNNCDPAFGYVPQSFDLDNTVTQLLPNSFYIWFSSNRAATGKYGIWYLNVAANTGALPISGPTIATPESGQNPATALITSDLADSKTPVGGYNNFEPAVPPFISYDSILYVSPRFLVNNSIDNPLVNAYAHGAPAFGAPPAQNNVPTNTATSPGGAFAPIDSELGPTGGLEILGSKMIDIDAPTLLRYSTSEIMHIESYLPSETSPGVTERTFAAGTSVKFVVRLSDRQSGVGQVYLQIKNPNSAYQDSAGVEHKVYTKDPFAINPATNALLHPTTTLNPFGAALNEATTLWEAGSGSPAIFGYSATNNGPVYGGVMHTAVPPAYVGLGYSTTKNILTGYNGGPFNVPGAPAYGTGSLSGGGVAVMPTVTTAPVTQISVKGIDALEAVNRGNNNGAGDYLVTGDLLDLYDYTGAYVETVQCVGCGPDAGGKSPVSATLYVTQVVNGYAVPTGTKGTDLQPGYVAVHKVGYFDFQGVEVDSEALVAGTGSQIDATQPANYVIPPYTPGVDDQTVLSGDGTAPPLDNGNTGRPIWLPLTPVPTTDPDYDTEGGVLYTATWQTPQMASDYYVDVIAYDNAVQYNQNWRIYDNVWGFSTKPFSAVTSPGGVLLVNDYMLPQKFFGAGFGVYNPANIPPNFFGGESYLTDIDVNYDDPNQNIEGGVGQLASLPSSAWTEFGTTTITEFMTPFFHRADSYGYSPYYPNTLGVNSYTDSRQANVQLIEPMPTFPIDPSQINKPGAYLGVQDGYQEGNVGVANPGIPNPPSQHYDIWRILSRGPLPSDVLSLYAPQVVEQPADAAVPGSTAKKVLVASSCVIWASPFAGDEFADSGTIVDPNTQTELTNFATAGGRLFVEGINVGFALTEAGGTKNAFYNSILNAAYTNEDLSASQGAFTLTGGTNQTDYIGHDAALNNNGGNYPANADPSQQNFKLADLDPIGLFPNWTYNPPSSGRLSLALYTPGLIGNTQSVSDCSLDDGGTLGLSGVGFVDGFTNAIATVPPATGPIVTIPAESTELKGTGVNDRLVYTMMAKPTGVDLNTGIVAYSSFGLESVTQAISPLNAPPFIPFFDTNHKLPDIPIWSLEAQRTDLVHNLIDFLRTGTLVGQVLNTNGDTGVPFAEVRATPDGAGGYNAPTQVYTAIADGNGNYRIVGVPGGRYDMSAYAPGTTFQHTNGAVIDVHGGDVSAKLNVQVSPVPPGSLLVTVKDANTGVVIAGASVTAAEELTGTPSYTATTSSSGLANFPSVSAAVYTVTGTAPGYGPGTGTATVATGTQTAITILLPAAPSTVTGTVTDASTKLPIAQAVVTLTPVLTTGSAFSGTTNASGKYTIASVQPGSYTVTCAATGYLTQSEAETVGSSVTATYNFQLSKAPTGEIYGLVSRQADGAAVNPATVTLTDTTNPSNKFTITTTATTFTGPDGKAANYKQTGVPYSTYTAAVSAAGYSAPATQTVTLSTASSRADFQFPSLHQFASGLQLFSVPYNYIGATAFSLTQIFGYTSPKLAVWQPTSFAYALTPTPPANSLVAGQGYWVRFPHSVGLLLAGTPLSNTTGTTASISLQAGWNMIGEPFETNIPISSLMFTDSTGNQYTYAQASSPQVQLIDPSLYYYDSNAGQYAVSGSSDTLTEWYGYWIQAMAPCTMIVTHP